MDCLDPPLEHLPVDDWYCPECALEGEGGLEQPFRPSSEWINAKRKGWQTRLPALSRLSQSVNGTERDSEPLEKDNVVSRSEFCCTACQL